MFWDELSPIDRDALEAVGTRKIFAAGDVLFMEGDPSHHVTIVLAGRVKLTTRSINGQEVMIEFRGPGTIIGELGAIDGTPRAATATAVDIVVSIVIEASRFRRVVHDHPHLSNALLVAVIGKLRQATGRRLESGTTLTLTRLCRRLVELVDHETVGDTGEVEVSMPLNQSELAEWIGASRDSVVLALRELRRRGWVETGRGRVRILNMEAVRKESIN